MIHVIDADGRVRTSDGAGDMGKAVYDPDDDGVVAAADYAATAGDADTLDGAHAAAFAAAAHDHTPTQTLVLGTGGWPASTAGCAALAKSELPAHKIDLQTFDFDKDTVEYLEFLGVMPDNWDGGRLTGRFYWTHAAASGAFGVCWGLQGRAYADDDALDQAWGTAQYVTDTGGTAHDLYISPETATITLAGSTGGGRLVIFRVLRKADDAADTLAADARLLCVKVEYGVSGLSA